MSQKHPVAAGLSTLSEILEKQKSRGVTQVPLGEKAAEDLRSFPRKMMELSLPKSAAPSQSAVETAIPVSVPVSAASEKVVLSEKEARAELNKVFKEVKASETLRSLGTLHETIVFATGNPCADLMFVGEAPGSEEEVERKPFVGPSGQKLTAIIGAMGLSRDEVYISNIVKFRPKKGDGRMQGTSNRKPSGEEMAASIPHLRREIEIVQPRVIIALGATAAEGLLEIGGTVGSLRGKTHLFEGLPLIVTYHPSYILRQEGKEGPRGGKETKRAVWEDFLRAMELLEMPISEKQRGYFL